KLFSTPEACFCFFKIIFFFQDYFTRFYFQLCFKKQKNKTKKGKENKKKKEREKKRKRGRERGREREEERERKRERGREREREKGREYPSWQAVSRNKTRCHKSRTDDNIELICAPKIIVSAKGLAKGRKRKKERKFG